LSAATRPEPGKTVWSRETSFFGNYKVSMIFTGFLILAVHYVISYLVCVYFKKSREKRLSKLGTFLVVVLSGPLTLVSILAIIFITPLRNTDAGLFDGGGTLMVLLSLFIFPIVSRLLVKLLVTKKLVEKNAL
jgi:hypothetical protein